MLVGPNMSGKSNLIDLLQFLTTLATVRPGLQGAVVERGGFNEILWKGGDEKQISIAITVALPRAEDQPQPQMAEYALSLMGGPGGNCMVESEKLTVQVDGEEPRTIYEIGFGRQGVVEEQGKLRPINLSNWSTALESVGLPNVEADQFRNIVAGWLFYQLLPALMRQENAPSPEPFLKQHGENFSSWITTLQTYPEEFRQIRQAVCDAFPDLAEIIIQPTQASKIVLSTHEKYLRRATPISRMSDGELAFLRWTRSLGQRSGVFKVENPAPDAAVIVPEEMGSR
jgi:predicted ATPase